MKQRIWELDAFRGICIVGMVLLHLLFDCIDLFGLFSWQYPPLLTFLANWGGILFLIVSGICVTLGHRHLTRGLIVLGCGLLCTAVTFGLYKLELFGYGIVIWFGVLHCVGICMLLWEPLRRLKVFPLLLLAVALLCLSIWVRGIRVSVPYFAFLGLVSPGFSSADYFPLLPYLGFFLLGAVMGKTLYREKKSLLPPVRGFGFFQFCGRHSLWIYLLHQPLLTGIFLLYDRLF